MKSNIPDLLQKAMVIHRLPSYYKLALVMGVDHKSLRNYRDGKTLPDARVIHQLCELTGDDPALLLVEIEEMRAKTDEARALWHQIAQRLQAGAATAVFAVAFLVAGMVCFPSDAQARAAAFSQLTNLYIVECARAGITRLIRALMAPAVRYLRGLTSGGNHVLGAASTAAA